MHKSVYKLTKIVEGQSLVLFTMSEHIAIDQQREAINRGQKTTLETIQVDELPILCQWNKV